LINILPLLDAINRNERFSRNINCSIRMHKVAGEHENKKWSDLVKTSAKMLQFARDELEEGNLLSTKSILDSLQRNIN
jgi:hypothetical protein